MATVPSKNQPDVVLIGAGIMSATFAVLLNELDPSLKIELYEVLGSAAQESSNAWNNAGTGHAAFCELQHSPAARQRHRHYKGSRGQHRVRSLTTGSGHKWRLVNGEPWKRAYVVLKKGADTQFVPDSV